MQITSKTTSLPRKGEQRRNCSKFVKNHPFVDTSCSVYRSFRHLALIGLSLVLSVTLGCISSDRRDQDKAASDSFLNVPIQVDDLSIGMTEDKVHALKGQPQTKDGSSWTYDTKLRLDFEGAKLAAIWNGHTLTTPNGEISAPVDISNLAKALGISLESIERHREGYASTLNVQDGNVLIVWVAYKKATSFDLLSKSLAEKGS